MFKNYLKIAFRNLWKNKGYTAINIGGLAAGLAGFILLLLYVNYEYSYDAWSPQLKNVYQVHEMNTFFSSDAKGAWNDQCDTRIGSLMRESLPGVSAVTMVDALGLKLNYGIGIQAGNKAFLEYKLRDSDSSFFKVFPYRFMAGNPGKALDKIHSMVVTESLARKWFSSTDVLGKTVKIKYWIKDPGTIYEITGVIRKPAGATTVDFDAIYRSGQNDRGMDNSQNTHFANIYIKAGGDQPDTTLNRQADKIYIASLSHLLQSRNSSLTEYAKAGHLYGIQLQPLKDAHLHPVNSKSPMDRISPALILSILLLLVAVINFANLSTAGQRGKEMGVRKVMGADKKALVSQFMIETGIQCLSALFIALLLVELCMPFFNRAFDSSLSLSGYHAWRLLWWQLIIITAGVLLLSGSYPAFFLSGYDPAKVLKGNFSRGAKGISIRNTLIVVQFLIATVFITGIVIIKKQVGYMVHTDIGFQPAGLLNLRTGYNRQLIERLKTIPGVEDIGINSQTAGNSMDWINKIKYRGEVKELNIATVSMETFNAMHVKLADGRLFSPRFGQDTLNSIILNQSAARLLGGNVVGKSLYENDSLEKHIVGVIADYHYEGFNKAILPTVYALINSKGPSVGMNNLLVRVDSKQYKAVISRIQKAWETMYPDYPLQYTFMNDDFLRLVADDIQFSRVVSVFTALSLILSLIGIFALSAFITVRRTKEISIRKVLGASLPDILRLLNRNFVLLVLIASVIAWPVAYILVKYWLNGFVYRVDISLLPFMIATIASIVLTICTVSIQVWRAATANPAEALKYE